MNKRGRLFLGAVLSTACAFASAGRSEASGVPVGGFLPLVGIGLSNEYSTELLDLYAAYNTAQPAAGIMFGNGSPNFDLALLDTGAGFSLLTDQAYDNFNIEGFSNGTAHGFGGSETFTVAGATGTLNVSANEPLGLYASGVQNRTGGPSFAMNLSVMKGQTNTSTGTLPATSDLPNVVGLPFASRYATYIRNDLPQIFTLNGRTVRTPWIDFLAQGTGGSPSVGIPRRAFMSNQPSGSISGTPVYIFNQTANWDFDHPYADPSAPTVLATGTGGSFLNVTATENSTLATTQFLFDSGADLSVVSSLTANQLGYQGVPDFTVAVVGSGGTAFDVPGFFVNDFTILAETASNHAQNNIVLHNVPVIILDIKNPADTENIVPGVVGTNVLAGRNIVYDPINNSGPSLYISDPVTIDENWTTAAASGTFGTGGNWSGGIAPDLATNRGIANVRHVSGGNQTAVVAANAQVWEVNVSGTPTQTMTLQVQSSVTLQTFSGINIELGGSIQLQNGTLDALYVEVFGGTLSGVGTITTGSGPIPGQVENRGGTVAPGNGVGTLTMVGRFASGPAATLAIELAGLNAGLQHDQIIVDGPASLGGTLNVSLVGFTPSVGNAFTILTSDSLSGHFDNLLLPAGYQWNVDYGLTDVVLSVTGLSLAGDFNGDNHVNLADYVGWRKNNGTTQDYQTWRSNFGSGFASAAEITISASVPEPGSIFLAVLATFAFATRRKRPATHSARS